MCSELDEACQDRISDAIAKVPKVKERVCVTALFQSISTVSFTEWPQAQTPSNCLCRTEVEGKFQNRMGTLQDTVQAEESDLNVTAHPN